MNKKRLEFLSQSFAYLITAPFLFNFLVAGVVLSLPISASASIQTLTLPMVSILANPYTINQSGSSILSWNSSNATFCNASGGWSGNKSTSGSEVVSPPVTTTYTIICFNSVGQASDRVTVSVVNTLPTVNLATNPSNIISGNSSILSWNSTGATSCVAWGGWSGNKNLNGVETVSPSVSTTYHITCSNSYGQAGDTVTVTVNQNQPSLPTVHITANPSYINQGGTTILNWNSTNASNCIASGGWSGYKAPSGSEVVYPFLNSTYGITCEGNNGTANNSTNVYVNSVLYQPPITIVPPFNAACVSSPDIANVGREVFFASGVSGGRAPYTYSWNGDVSGNTENFTGSFDTVGTKIARLTVRDSNGAVANASCTTIVRNNPVIITTVTRRPTPPPAPPTIVTAATNYCDINAICAQLGYVRSAMQNCEPYYPNPNSGSGGINYGQTNNNPEYNFQNTGTGYLTPTPTSGFQETNNSTGENKSLFANIFFTERGNPSRFLFLLMWYFAILGFIGFISLIAYFIKRERSY